MFLLLSQNDIQLAVFADILLYGIHNSIYSGSAEEQLFAIIIIVYIVIIQTISRLNPVSVGCVRKLHILNADGASRNIE